MPMWPMNGILVCLELIGFESQRRQTEVGAAAVEHPDHHFFAKLGRQGADSEVDFVPLRERQFDSPVLWNPPFGDIQM